MATYRDGSRSPDGESPRAVRSSTTRDHTAARGLAETRNLRRKIAAGFYDRPEVLLETAGRILARGVLRDVTCPPAAWRE